MNDSNSSKEFFDILVKAVNILENVKTGEQIFNPELYIKEENARSVATDTTFKVYLRDKKLINIRDYKVTYICPVCKTLQTILLLLFIRKFKQKIKHCRYCAQKEKYGGKPAHPNLKFYKKQIKESHKKYDFELESQEYKDEYFKRPNNLTQQLFNYIIKNTVKIDDDYLNHQKIEFIIAKPCKNALKYSLKIKIDNIEHDLNFWLKCSVCGKLTKPHISTLKTIDFNKPILCNTCSFVNCVFPLQKYTPLNITYLSKLELVFLQYCEKYNVKVLRGPKVLYCFEQKIHNYNIDYYLPDYKYIIELKENHIYHRKQVLNGKWKCKEDSAKKYASDNKLEFKLLFTKDVKQFFEELLKEIV